MECIVCSKKFNIGDNVCYIPEIVFDKYEHCCSKKCLLKIIESEIKCKDLELEDFNENSDEYLKQIKEWREDSNFQKYEYYSSLGI